MTARKRKSARKSHSGCLILLVGFVILLIAFIIEFPNIKATLEKTRFLDLVKERATTSSTSTTTAADLPSAVPNLVVPPTEKTTTVAPSAPSPSGTTPSTKAVDKAPEPETPAAAPSPSSTSVQGATRQASLFFVRIEDDGVISRHEVRRMIPATDSPLSDAINALLGGPTEGEIRSKLISLIPRGTKLLGINIRGSTAIIDLSEAFMYNHYGIEGYSAQLKQIVYTATSFSSVQDVQILVEGKVRDYLGGEGVFIGKPLSRNSF